MIEDRVGGLMSGGGVSDFEDKRDDNKNGKKSAEGRMKGRGR